MHTDVNLVLIYQTLINSHAALCDNSRLSKAPHVRNVRTASEKWKQKPVIRKYNLLTEECGVTFHFSLVYKLFHSRMTCDNEKNTGVTLNIKNGSIQFRL